MSVLIAINQIQREKPQEILQEQGPLDLLPKQTRAMCRRLIKHKEKLRPRNSRGRKGIVCCAGVWSRPEVVTAIKHQTDWKNNKQNKDVTTSKSGQEKLGKI